MSLRAQAAKDATRNLADEGDPVSVTLPSGAVWRGRGRVSRVDDRLDPMTGQMIHAPRTRVVLPLDAATATIEERNAITTTDVLGTSIIGVVVDPSFDRTIGMMSCYVEMAE